MQDVQRGCWPDRQTCFIVDNRVQLLGCRLCQQAALLRSRLGLPAGASSAPLIFHLQRCATRLSLRAVWGLQRPLGAVGVLPTATAVLVFLVPATAYRRWRLLRRCQLPRVHPARIRRRSAWHDPQRTLPVLSYSQSLLVNSSDLAPPQSSSPTLGALHVFALLYSFHSSSLIEGGRLPSASGDATCSCLRPSCRHGPVWQAQVAQPASCPAMFPSVLRAPARGQRQAKTEHPPLVPPWRLRT